MIPNTVELTDFLSHRCADGEPVVFDFDGAVLWSVSGDNGAGKSAIFDAITWTLFNEHRGGRQDAQRLISHGADWCSAAFSFTLDGERYRVERSLRRRGSTKRSAARWDGEKESWEEIPETSNERGFERWRNETLGLSYAAFTQSVLLLQGDSDRLIRAGAKERFEILAQLVDLNSYKALEDRARELASEARGQRNAVSQDLERLTPVGADERRAAIAEVERLTAERTTRDELRAVQTTVVAGAVEHERLQQRLAATREAIAAVDKPHAEGALAAAEQTAKRADRLRRALPAIETAVLRRRELAEVEAALEELGSDSDAAKALAVCEQTVADFKSRLDEAREAERDLGRRVSTLEAETSQLERELTDIRAGSAEAVCSRCGQEVPAGQRETHLAHTEEALAERSGERDAARTALEQLSSARGAAEQAVEAKLGERAQLELRRTRAGDLEQALRRARRAARTATDARGLREWEDERVDLVRQGPIEDLGSLLEGLYAEGERLDREADRLAAEAKVASEAQRQLDELRGAEAALATQLDEIPSEHRVPLAEATAELERRKTAAEEIGQLVEQAQAQLRDLDRREEALRERREDLARAERSERLANRMASLLGRQGLQGQLLAHAARSLEALANDTLRALTGGTLSLEIRPDERRGRDEITIAARDLDAGGERTDAAFLSGSEKFRVCVAMAAAIGKYVGGQATIESLIVDEGFGSLDEVGRDEMIDELQRLAGLLARVIVVSHQGEFQDRTRFPHGYRLRREAGQTTIDRYV